MQFDLETLHKVERTTFTDYESVNGIVTVDKMYDMIKDLLSYHEMLAEQINDIIQDRNDNWKRKSDSELYE